MAFDLEALGGLRLIGATAQVVHAQRRRLALLALLAAAGDRGLTRDQLIGCLWPETTDENARHALNQLIYGIRRSLSEDALRGADSLRLNPEVIDSDVRRFERARAAGAYDEAITHYRGPFLEGFHLPDAPAFERRVEEDRARLAAAHVDALERVAAQAEHRGDAVAAVGWRRALAELDGLDARRALALMRALVAAGDSTGAVAHARSYEALVRAELGTAPDPGVIALVAEIRASTERARTSPESRNDRTSQPDVTSPPPVPVAEAGALGLSGPAADNDARSVASAQSSADSRRSPARRRRRVLAYGLGALALTATLLAAGQLRTRRASEAIAPAPVEPSIAVLPLTNLSADPADAVLAGGMTAELISTLSRVEGLRVIPSTSVYALRARDLDARQIADTLGVSHILESGLQKVGSLLRVQVRLVGRDGSTRWSETYDREVSDIFAVQDEIAHAVTREIDVRLVARDGGRSPARRYTPSVEAYEWYLRGMDLTLIRSKDGRRNALDYFERAIAADSNFAAAHAGLVRIFVYDAGDAPGGQHASFARAERAALKAVALDDSLPAAHVALGWARTVQRNWAAAEAEFKHAIALDARAPRAHEGLARVYLWTGRRSEALANARVGLENEPFSHTAIRELAHALSMNGRCDEAVELLRPLKALTPPAGVAGVLIGQCYASKQMWPEAIAEFRWAMDTEGPRAAVAFLGYALARSGQTAEAERILSDLLTGRTYSHGAFGIATVYAGLRDTDAALIWIGKSIDENSVRVYMIGPMFDDLRDDPRFDRVMRRIGL